MEDIDTAVQVMLYEGKQSKEQFEVSYRQSNNEKDLVNQYIKGVELIARKSSATE